MKKIMGISVVLLLSISSFAMAATDELNFSGNYLCNGYDSHDGAYNDAKLKLTLDAKNSDFKHGFSAYHLTLTEKDGTQYLGEVAANGNMLGVYFENVGADDKAKTDRGVGMEVATYDKDQNGQVHTVLHKFYYEPTYENGGHGSQTCVKQ